MADSPTTRKTLAAYAEDRAKLNTMKVPLLKSLEGSGVDREYRVEQKVEYLLGMVGHLLRRVEELEAAQGAGKQGEAAQGEPAQAAPGGDV